jgi:hypothetical protein
MLVVTNPGRESKETSFISREVIKATHGLPQSLKAITVTPTYIGTESYFIVVIIIIIIILDGIDPLACSHSELIVKLRML